MRLILIHATTKDFWRITRNVSWPEPWQRDELEVWHRGWITKLMTGDATSKEYNAAIPPHPDPHHPEDDDE